VFSSRPRRIRFAASALVFALAAAPLAAQQADEALVGQLAAVLALADARHFDEAVLREALRHSDADVRRQAALAAGRIGDAAAVDLLLPALDDSSAVVQGAAAFALGLLKDARAVASLVAFVRAAPPDSQQAPHLEAVTAIAKIGGEEGARALRDVLGGGLRGTGAASATAARAALEAWRLGARAPVTALVGFTTAPDRETRYNAIYSLARLRAGAGANALLAALRDREADIRAVAARGVVRALADSAHLEPRGVVERLRPLLDDSDPNVRILALRSLASFRDSTAAPAVVALLADVSLGVQVQAETTLGALGGSRARDALRGRLTNVGFALRRQATIALAEADSAGGVQAAAQLLSESDWRWRSVAAEAFGAARDRARLVAALDDPDGRVAVQALQALQRVVPAADTTILPRARALLGHADPAVRSVAADLLARVPRTADVDALVDAYRRAEGDPFNDARLSAVLALGAIAQSGADGRLRVVNAVLAAVRPSTDYLVRRAVAAHLTDVAEAWGSPGPIVTGRTDADYRDVVRRYLLPALRGAPPLDIAIETDRGALRVRLLPAEAPLTVAAFLGLVDQRFFDGHRWHRVVPNFVVQDGDPRGDGWGSPGFVLRDEVNPVRYQAGTVGIALSGPDTGGSQFFIAHSAQPHLDGVYTVFGTVVAGTSVLAAIAQGDHIRSIHR